MRRSIFLAVLALLLLTTACSKAPASAGTIRIGAALSETGRFAAEGHDSRLGYDTWAHWVNNDYGGIRIGDQRHQVEIVYYDDQSDPTTAANQVQRLIDEGVDFLLAPYSSTLTFDASAVAEENTTLMLIGNGTSDVIYERGFEHIFLVATVGSDYTKSSIEALAAAGARNAIVSHDDSPFSVAVGNGAVNHLEANAMVLITRESYYQDPENLSYDGIETTADVLSWFADLNPDALVGGGYYNDAVLLAQTADEVGFNPAAMLLTVGPSNPQFVDDIGSAAEGLLGPTQWDASMTYTGNYFGTADDYATYFETLWGEAPVYQAASSTAAALALHLAIEAAGSTDTNAVRNALLDLDVNTFYGPINFDTRGVNTAKPMGTVQIQDGEIVVVAPPSAAVADLRYPIN